MGQLYGRLHDAPRPRPRRPLRPSRPVLAQGVAQCEQRGDLVGIHAVTRGTAVQEGGYLWRGEMRLWDNEMLMGWYVATEQAIRSKGTMYFVIHKHGQSATGRWVGLSHDADIVTGWASLAKTEDEVTRIMNQLRERPVTP